MSEKIYEVRAIENGTVIDHIPPRVLFKIVSVLGLDGDTRHRMTIGTNLESRRMGTKAIIKIADRYPAEGEIDRIALFAPEARVNTIRDFKVVDKRLVRVPSEIRGFVRCANPMCVTNHQPVETAFEVLPDPSSDAEPVLRCRYCEKVTRKF